MGVREQVTNITPKDVEGVGDDRSSDMQGPGKAWPTLREGCALAVDGHVAVLIDACDLSFAWTADLRVGICFSLPLHIVLLGCEHVRMPFVPWSPVSGIYALGLTTSFSAIYAIDGTLVVVVLVSVEVVTVAGAGLGD